MTLKPRRVAAVAVLAMAAAGLAACSSTSTTSSSAAVKPPTKPTGTLRIVAAAGPDHIDTVPAYYTADYELERAYARQLVSYPTVPTTTTSGAAWVKATTPVADMATEVPTTANGGISDGGLLYTFHIKKGVDWDTTPARQVVADDFIREFKAFCNPVSPVGNPLYYTSTIVGLTSYCNAETAYFKNSKAHPPTAANIAGFQNSHTISGMSSPSPLTLQIKLMQPASDFLNMMAMPFASARPVEYDSYVPNSLALDTHTISDGPYQISSYIPGKSITLTDNPAYKQSTDPLQHQYLKSIVVTEGVTSAATQLADFEAGTEDLPMDTPLDPAAIPGLISGKNPQFHVWPWSDTFPYIVFNLRSPDSGGAMGKLLVRQAIEYGVNKVAVLKVYGGPKVATIINDASPPGSSGASPSFQLYSDGSGLGDTAMCKADLKKAGYPHGVTLTYLYPNDSTDTQAFTAIQASLAPCGVHLTGKPEPGSSFFVDLGNAPENNKPNQWDMGQAGWIPDWFGADNGRSTLQPLYETNCVVNTTNDGCFNSPTVDALIKKAETTQSVSAAAVIWHEADIDVMKQAAVVPLISQNFPLMSSDRVYEMANGKVVNYALFAPNIGDPDITNIWVK
jgi:peptide/nickel transport system substrate-binding protein